jgi:hypothetical protein
MFESISQRKNKRIERLEKRGLGTLTGENVGKYAIKSFVVRRH